MTTTKLPLIIQLELEEGRDAKADLQMLRQLIRWFLTTNNARAAALLADAINDTPGWREEAKEWTN
jgi:hypothetical protein